MYLPASGPPPILTPSARFRFLQDRLYHVSLRTKPSEETTKSAHFFTMDNELIYWNFFLDFGPLNLAQLYRFCQRLNTKLKSEALRDKVIYYYSGSHAHKRTNAAFLICAWSVLYLDRTPEEAYRPFRGTYPPFPPFHDASPCVCTYNLNILDCLRGLAKARYYKFFDFSKFNVEEYEYYEQVRPSLLPSLPAMSADPFHFFLPRCFISLHMSSFPSIPFP